VAQVVERLTNKYEALSSNPSTTKKIKVKPKASGNQFGYLKNNTSFVFLQRHLNWTDISVSLEDFFQLLSSQHDCSLEVTGTLAFILAGTNLH
jgi:hypothetical protein